MGIKTMIKLLSSPPKCGVPVAWATILSAVLMAPAGTVLAAPVLTTALQEQAEFLCRRTEFTRTEIRQLQRSGDFPVILAYTLDACPNVASVLADGATASIAPRAPRDNDNSRAPGGKADKPEKSKESPKGI